jgi:hypothetical protein
MSLGFRSKTRASGAGDVVYVAQSYLGWHEDPGEEISYLDGDRWVAIEGIGGRVQRLLPTTDGVLAVGAMSSQWPLPFSAFSIATINQGGFVPLGTAWFGGERGPFAVAEHDGRVCLGGTFTAIDEVPARNVACLENGVWTQAGEGLNGPVRSLAFDASGRLVAGGAFVLPDGENVAVLDGDQWRALGGGVDGEEAVVEAIAVVGSEIVAGGHFSRVGQAVAARNLARFDGQAWRVPPGGVIAPMGEDVAPEVRDLEVLPGGGVYVVGNFVVAGQRAASRVALWVDEDFVPVVDASDPPSGVAGEIRAFARDADGSLVAAGELATAGMALVAHVARLRDGSWEAMGDPGGPVDALIRTSDGSLVVGGALDGLRRWDGGGWTALGPAVNARVRTAVEWNGSLVIGGDFTQAGSTPAMHVARLGSGSYQPLGNGLPGPVRVLAPDDRGRLCAGLVDASPSPLWCWDGRAWAAEPVRGRSVADIRVVHRGGADVLLVAGDLLSADERPAFAAKRDSRGWEAIRNPEEPRATVGLAVVPYRDGALIAIQGGCCSRLVWWEGQPAEAGMDMPRYPAVAPTQGAFFGAAAALRIEGDQLLIGAPTTHWIDGASWHVSAGWATLDLSAAP